MERRKNGRMCSLTLGFLLVTLVWGYAALAETNLLINPGFEEGLQGWNQNESISIDETEKHSGKYSLKIKGGPTGTPGVLIKEVILNQKEPEAVEVSYWGKRTSLDPDVLSAIQINVCFDDNTSINWYGQFYIDATQSGNWVFKRSVFYPRSPITKLQINVRRSGIGQMWIDDLYAGLPVKEVSAQELAERKNPLPVNVITKKMYEEYPACFKLLSLLPEADVIGYDSSDYMPFSFKIEYEVIKPAPISLNSSSGSQTWEAFNFNTRRIISFHTNEKIELKEKGKKECIGKLTDNVGLNRFYNPIEKGSYILLAGEGITKTFNINDSAGKNIGYFKIADLGLHYNPANRSPIFLLANLKKYNLSFSESGCDWKPNGYIWTKILLTDGDNQQYTLFGGKVKGELRKKDGRKIEVILNQEFDSTGMPTGLFIGKIPEKFTPDEVYFNAEISIKDTSEITSKELSTTIKKGVGKISIPKKPSISTSFAGIRNADDLNSYIYNSGNSIGGQKSIEDFIKKLAKSGFNTVTLYVNPRGKAIYKSKILPLECPEWDPLQTVINSAHQNGMKVGACVCLFVRYNDTHPEWVAVDSNGKKVENWYEFSNPEVQKYYLDIIKEVVENYNIDILYLDYIRPGPGGYSELSRKEYQKKFGRDPLNIDYYDPELIQWKQDIITDYVKEIQQTIKKIKPEVKLMVYVWAMYNTVNNRSLQDVPKWLKENDVDILQMGNYKKNLYWFRSICNVLKTIQEQNDPENNVEVVPLMGVGYAIANTVSFQEEENQIIQELIIAREEGYKNIGFFSCHPLAPHLESIGEKIR